MLPDRADITAFGKWMGLLRDKRTGSYVGRKMVYHGRSYVLFDDGRTERWTWALAEQLEVLNDRQATRP